MERLRDLVGGLGATLVDIGQTRVELAATELEEQRLLLARQSTAATLALFFACLSVGLACALVVFAVPPEWRVLTLAGLCLLALAVTAALVWHWQRLAANRPPLLAATLAELRKDADALRGRP